MDINLILKIESLHRFVFDKLYVQSKKTYSEEEQKKLDEYKDLSKRYSSWRKILILEYLVTKSNKLESILKVNKKNNTCRYGSINIEDYDK